MGRGRNRQVSEVSGVTRVIGYVRVSTIGQVESGASLESQRQAITAECARRGWELVEIVEDAGVSGKKLDRQGMLRALDLLQHGKANVLMAAKLDRLSRRVKDVCALDEMGARYGFGLLLLDAKIDTTTPYGRAQLNMMATFAQLERELISQRTKEGLAVKRAQGVRLGRPVQLPEEVAASVAELRDKGLSMGRIANLLNAHEVPTATGGKWHASTVQNVLSRQLRVAA